VELVLPRFVSIRCQGRALIFGLVDELDGAVQSPEWRQLSRRSKLPMVALPEKLNDAIRQCSAKVLLFENHSRKLCGRKLSLR
jgi:hypothetical protein